MENGVISCRFTRPIASPGNDRIADFSSNIHVFLASGPMKDRLVHGMHTVNPVASSKQDLTTVGAGRVAATDANQETRPLWKAHGILMIIAWVLVALCGTLQPRYYREMWPNSRPCGLQVWFAVHRPLMFIATILFTIAFILAMVAAKGEYRQQPQLPQKAHPILGLIALILGWINPIISFFRCNPGAHYRPVFNWIHFW